MGRGARSTEGKIGRSAERRFFAECGFSSDFDIFYEFMRDSKESVGRCWNTERRSTYRSE